VISAPSNVLLCQAEQARRLACDSLATAISNLAATLLTAKQVYAGVDSDLRENIDKQVLPK
jgi:hypothetical protein